MKDFLSEYGFAILAAIVVILLIAMCTPVGNLIKNQIMGVVDSFATKTESKLYSLDADNTLGVAIAQVDENGKFSIKATTDSETDVLKASYRVKDQNGNWGPWTDLGNLGSGKEHSGEFQAKIENGNKIQVRVTDEGKADNLFYESNIIEYTGASSAGGDFTPTGGETITKAPGLYVDGVMYRELTLEDCGQGAKNVKNLITQANTEVILPEGLTEVSYYANGVFVDCTNLKSITIPEGVNKIGMLAFYRCTNLESITIPEGVTLIDMSAFDGCTNLKSITIPDTVTQIGYQAFMGTGLKSITIPKGATVKSTAVMNCADLSEAIIYGNIESGGRFLENCKSLKKLVYNGNLRISNGISSAFPNIESVTFIEGTTTIADSYTNSKTLKTINFPASLTSIGSIKFEGCTNLTSITFEEDSQLESIGLHAFTGCTSLTSVTIPNSVTSIGERAFYECTNLTSVTIPNSVTSIGLGAFYKVSHIYYNGSATGSPWGAYEIN